jgi:hypothetical protein
MAIILSLWPEPVIMQAPPLAMSSTILDTEMAT